MMSMTPSNDSTEEVESMTRKIRWSAEVSKASGVIEVDDNATEDDIWAEVDAEAEQHFCTDWKEADPQ